MGRWCHPMRSSTCGQRSHDRVGEPASAHKATAKLSFPATATNTKMQSTDTAATLRRRAATALPTFASYRREFARRVVTLHRQSPARPFVSRGLRVRDWVEGQARVWTYSHEMGFSLDISVVAGPIQRSG